MGRKSELHARCFGICRYGYMPRGVLFVRQWDATKASPSGLSPHFEFQFKYPDSWYSLLSRRLTNQEIVHSLREIMWLRIKLQIVRSCLGRYFFRASSSRGSRVLLPRRAVFPFRWRQSQSEVCDDVLIVKLATELETIWREVVLCRCLQLPCIDVVNWNE